MPFLAGGDAKTFQIVELTDPWIALVDDDDRPEAEDRHGEVCERPPRGRFAPELHDLDAAAADASAMSGLLTITR